MKRVSIVIVTYNSEKHIFDCVRSIEEHADIAKDDIELIIVDNCSREPDQMFQRLREQWGTDILCIKNTRNGGYGQGNNVGIRAATAPVIMIMNPDVRLVQPVFREMLDAFSADSNVALCGFTQLNIDGSIGRSTSWTSRLHPYIAEPLRFITGKLNIFCQKYMYVTGACFFLRKEAFVRAGMYDENIFMYAEEDDIHYRLMQLPGVRMRYLRHLAYKHMHPEVSDYANASHDWLEHTLDTLLYIDARDGLSQRRTILWAIKRNNISVWKETLKCILTRGANRDRLRYFQEWGERLNKKLKEYK